MWDARCPIHTVGLWRGRRTNERGQNAPPSHPLAHPPPHLFACPLLYSPHASSSISPLAFPLASAVVDGVRVLTWHGCLFAKGGRHWYWCCRLGGIQALMWHRWGMGWGVVVERACIADSTAFISTRVGGDQGDVGVGSYGFSGWLRGGWGADVAPERAVVGVRWSESSWGGWGLPIWV